MARIQIHRCSEGLPCGELMCSEGLPCVIISVLRAYPVVSSCVITVIEISSGPSPTHLRPQINEVCWYMYIKTMDYQYYNSFWLKIYFLMYAVWFWWKRNILQVIQLHWETLFMVIIVSLLYYQHIFLLLYFQTPKREVPDTIGRPDYADHPEGLYVNECCMNTVAWSTHFSRYSVIRTVGLGTEVSR